ncbi:MULTISPECIES: hypothetical protein [unclassified Bartonella]
MPNALEDAPQELKPHVNEQMQPQTQPLAPASPTPPPEPTDLEKFLQSNTYKFFQSDAYQKLKDLFAGMSAALKDGSGWDNGKAPMKCTIYRALPSLRFIREQAPSYTLLIFNFATALGT